MRLRRLALRRATLRGLRERAEGRSITLRGQVLAVAFMVGLCHSIIPGIAVPLTLNPAQVEMTTPKALAHSAVIKQWGKTSEYKCLEQLVQRESGWRVEAHNKSSGAFGLFQFLPGTWANYRYPYKPKEASIQIKAGLRYITKRYGTPCKAWAFWQSNAQKGNPWY